MSRFLTAIVVLCVTLSPLLAHGQQDESFSAPPPDGTSSSSGPAGSEPEENPSEVSDQAEDASGDETHEETTDEGTTGEGTTDDPFRDLEALEQELPGQDLRRSREQPLDLMTRDDLEESGFEFGHSDRSVSSSTAVLLALTAGLAVHGIGHLYLGDLRTGWLLVGMELVSLGLMGSSLGHYFLTNGSDAGVAAFAPTFQLGAGLFLFSYLLDVVGTVQGTEVQLAENLSLRRGIGLTAAYGFVNATGAPVDHAIDATLTFDLGGFYADLGTVQDVFLSAALYQGRVGVRPFRGATDLTHLTLDGRAEYFRFKGDGPFGRIRSEGRIGFSYDLGQSYPTLANFALGANVGYGHEWYQVAPPGSDTLTIAAQKGFVPFDVWADLNLTPRLTVRGGYGTPDGTFVPAVQRLLGVAHLDLRYRSSRYGDILFRTEVGDGVAIWIGGSLWFSRT